jgi:hypothetical protein
MKLSVFSVLALAATGFAHRELETANIVARATDPSTILDQLLISVKSATSAISMINCRLIVSEKALC